MPSADTKVELIAICTIQPGKLERMKALTASFIATVEAREPGTLSFNMIEELEAEEPQLVMVESYADSAAKDAHMVTPHFKALFAQFEEENLFAKPPQQILGKKVTGFTR